MQDHPVEDFISAYFGDSILTQFQDAWKIIEDFEYPNWAQPYLDSVMQANVKESFDILTELRGSVIKQLTDILKAHQIVFIEDTPISTLIEICKGLRSVLEYENKEALIDQLESDDDPSEVFCRVMSLVAPIRETELLAQLESVDQDLLSNLLDLLDGEDEPEVSTEDAIAVVEAPEYAKAINTFRDVVKPNPLLIDKYIQAGMQLGLPFKSYITIVAANHKFNLEDKAQLELLAADLLAVALISKDGNINPADVVKDYMNEITGDIQVGLVIDIHVKKLMKQYLYAVELEKKGVVL